MEKKNCISCKKELDVELKIERNDVHSPVNKYCKDKGESNVVSEPERTSFHAKREHNIRANPTYPFGITNVGHDDLGPRIVTAQCREYPAFPSGGGGSLVGPGHPMFRERFKDDREGVRGVW